MSPSNYKTVYQAKGILQAIVVKNFLEQAGLTTAIFSPSHEGLDVQVPSARFLDARSLLGQERRSCEMLYPATAI